MEYRCPVCGAAIAEGSAMCSVCKAGVRWQNGKPTPALEGKFASLFWKLTFAVMVVLAASAMMGWVVAERNALRTRIAQWSVFKTYIDWSRVEEDLRGSGE